MNSDLLIVVLAFGIGCPLFLYLRNKLWKLQRSLEHALPDAIEDNGLGERVVQALMARLLAGAPAEGLHPAAQLLGRCSRAAWGARVDVWRDGRPGGWLAGDLLKHLRPPLRANLQLGQLAPRGMIDAGRLAEELCSYVRFSLLPTLREGQRSAYHGWARKGRRR